MPVLDHLDGVVATRSIRATQVELLYEQARRLQIQVVVVDDEDFASRALVVHENRSISVVLLHNLHGLLSRRRALNQREVLVVADLLRVWLELLNILAFLQALEDFVKFVIEGDELVLTQGEAARVEQGPLRVVLRARQIVLLILLNRAEPFLVVADDVGVERVE